MNVDTGEFRALTDQVDEYREHEKLLIRAIAWMTGERPDVPRETPRRPQLRLIEGGKR